MSDRLKALFAVLEYSKREKLIEEYVKMGLPVNIMTHGHGSASSELLDYLGIGESRKILAVSIVPESAVKPIFNMLEEKANMKKQGMGIAFTCNISSMSSLISKLCEKITIENNSEGEIVMEQSNYEMILTIVTKGYFNQVMDAAKSAGATGGTLIHARGLGTEEAERFLGITIQPEKDLIMILATKDKKQAIMEAITKEMGLATEGKGICFAVPVSDTLGIGDGKIEKAE